MSPTPLVADVFASVFGRLDSFRGAWTLLGQCLDTRLDRLVLMFWAAQIILGGSWGAIRGRELLCWMLFLVLEAINKYKEKTHASLSGAHQKVIYKEKHKKEKKHKLKKQTYQEYKDFTDILYND